MEKKMTEFDVDCRICSVPHTVLADEKDVCNWQDGALIQDAMPYLTSGERELFISGVCGPCYDKLSDCSDEG